MTITCPKCQQGYSTYVLYCVRCGVLLLNNITLNGDFIDLKFLDGKCRHLLLRSKADGKPLTPTASPNINGKVRTVSLTIAGQPTQVIALEDFLEAIPREELQI